MAAIPHWTLAPDGTRISLCLVAKNWGAAMKFLNQALTNCACGWKPHEIIDLLKQHDSIHIPELPMTHFSRPGSHSHNLPLPWYSHLDSQGL